MRLGAAPPEKGTAGEARHGDRPVLASLVLVGGFVVLCFSAFRGWIPHDEGALGQAATRVLSGEIPHIDFHDTYGGLQAYAHAGAFQILGESIRTLRIANLVMAAIAGYSVFVTVRRFRSGLLAASAAIGTWLIGFALYPASMPTWWNVSLGLAAASLVHLWLLDRRDFHLLAAGILTGISISVKSTGAFVAMAIVLLLLMSAFGSSGRKSLIALGWLVALGFGVLVSGAVSLQVVVLLLVPLGMVVFVGFRHATRQSYTGGEDVTIRATLVFSVSVLAAVAVFALPYFLSGNADALFTGWIELPRLRLDGAASEIAVAPSYVLVLVLIGVVFYWFHRRLNQVSVLLSIVVLVVLVAAFGWIAWWRMVVTLVALAPLIVSAGVVRAGVVGSLHGGQLLFALSLVTFAFVQFPHSNAIYAIYLIPWIMVALPISITKRFTGQAVACLILLVATVLTIQSARGYLYMAKPSGQPVDLIELDLERAGILVIEQDHFYADLVDRLAGYEGSAIYAGPDAPEVYFLAGAKNPTPVLFDFLADGWGYGDLEAVLENRVAAVVVNREPDFSPPLPQGLVDRVTADFRFVSDFGPFDLYEGPSGHS